MNFDMKAVLAILIVIGCFGLLGIYVLRQETPDGVIIAIVAASLSGVVAFYFGHQNGTITALATSAAQLAGQAIEKRSTSLQGSPLPVVVVPAAPADTMPTSTVQSG